MRQNYWILYNYIRAERKFNCNESITYTTHGDFTFMDNLEPLLERWQGPISVAVYAPGSDFEDTVDTILYYRDCTNSKLVRDLATFHIFFDMTHIPDNIPRHNTFNQKVRKTFHRKRNNIRIHSEEQGDFVILFIVVNNTLIYIS